MAASHTVLYLIFVSLLAPVSFTLFECISHIHKDYSLYFAFLHKNTSTFLDYNTAVNNKFFNATGESYSFNHRYTVVLLLFCNRMLNRRTLVDCFIPSGIAVYRSLN